MEPLPRECIHFMDFFIYSLISIDLISYDWISDRCEVDSDLVRATRQQVDFEKCVFSFYDSSIAKFCFSDFWIHGIICGHFFSVIWISPDE